jgi:hypothetical protein
MGQDLVAQYRRAGSYVDRILRGEAGRPTGASGDQVRLDVLPALLARPNRVIE